MKTELEINQKFTILNEIAGCVPGNAAGEDESNLLQNFLPLRSYSKLADPKTFLVTGGRGTGKTELFRVLTSHDGLKHIISEHDRRRYTNLQSSEFLVGYIASGNPSKRFPTSNVCTDLLKQENSQELVAFWGGLACSSILNAFPEDEQLHSLAIDYLGFNIYGDLKERGSEISRWWEFAKQNKEKWETFLDKVDDLFEGKNIHVFLTYDELDKICNNYENLFVYIRSLLNFWYAHNNRFSNIKAKIFLRSDLYNSKSLQFVDSSKMRAYQLELQWNTLSLYRLLVKRMANTGNIDTVNYLKDIPGLLQDKETEGIGYLPGDSEDAFKHFIEKMIGKYMGKTPKRGASYTWVPNHIQDGNGEGAPRPFLKCFSIAAEEMITHPDEVEKLESDRLLLPTRLQGALAQVSTDRVKELTLEEYQWMQNLIERLKGKTMLMQEQEFLGYLTPEHWKESERKTLPGTTDREILEVLCSLGIVMKTPDGRINVPEIYLHGFGLKRKGGIKRPKGNSKI